MIRRSVALSAALVLLASGVLVDQAVARPQSAVPPTAIVPAAVSDPTGCLDDVTGAVTECSFGLEPVKFPAGRTIGEYEIALLTKNAQSGVPAIRPSDFRTGAVLGSCLPEQASCVLDNRIRVGSSGNTYASAQAVDPYSALADGGDTALATADFTGDGRDDIVTAAMCRVPGTSTATAEICMSLYDPGENTRTAWTPTGLIADNAQRLGRISLAAGRIAQTTTSVVGASFTTSADGSNLLMRLTTSAVHRLTIDDALRFDTASLGGLQDAICLPATSDGNESACAGKLGEGLFPVESISADRRSFVIALGTLSDANANAVCETDKFRCLPDGSREPLNWQAAPGGAIRVTGTHNGLAIAWAAPTSSARLAAIDVRPGTLRPFVVGDVHPLGAFGGPEQALDVVTGDFDGGMPDEIAVSWGGSCSTSCLRSSVLRWNDSKQLIQLSANSFATPRFAPVTSISLDSGNLTEGEGTNLDGDDLLLSWGTALSGLVEPSWIAYDMSPGLEFNRVDSAFYTESVPFFIPGSFRTLVSSAVADLDGDGVDEVIVASGMPTVVAGTSTIKIRVKSSKTSATTTWLSPNSTGAVGADYSGQFSLAVGQVGRSADPEGITLPNGVNPDVVLAWTCTYAASCGADPGAAASSVALLPLAAVVTPAAGAAAEKLELASKTGGEPSLQPAAALPSVYAPATSLRDYVDLVLPDLDGDSETLGSPVTYVTVGEVRPMLILRSPPVHFDAADGWVKKDGAVTFSETEDINKCFGKDTPADCNFSTEYSSTSTVESSFTGTVGNSWGIGASLGVNAWFGATSDDDGEKCIDPVCAALEVTLDVEYEAEQKDTTKAGSSFTYSFSKTALAGSDEALVFTQATETTEYPVFPGTSAFGGDLEPGRYVRVDSPVQSSVGWIDATDPNLSSSTWQRSVPGNVLSYAKNASALVTDSKPVVSAERTSDRTVLVTTDGNHGYSCALSGFKTTDGTRQLAPPGYLSDYPCAPNAAAVRLDGLGDSGSAFSGKSYNVSFIKSPDEIELTLSGAGTLPDVTWSAGASGCTTGCARGNLRRLPGPLGDNFQTVGTGPQPFAVEFNTTKGFDAEASWSLNTTLSTEVKFSSFYVLAGGGVNIKLKGNYKRSESASRSVAVLSGTKFSAVVSGSTKSGTRYAIRPYLTSDPVTNAMVFDWTADCSTNCRSGIWGTRYQSAPDLAFAIPRLLDPYKDPNNTSYDFSEFLRSPDLQTWNCTTDKVRKEQVCSAPPLLEAGKRTTLSATVHNYSLKSYASSDKPITVRYYVGDPARGGYPILETRVPRSAVGCSAGFTHCIPAQGQSSVQSNWTPPLGLAGRGTPAAPLPIYAVIRTAMTEVHPWTAPIDLAACDATYPFIDDLNTYYVDPDTLDPRPSKCPTTNNQAFVPLRFAGKPASATDLSVRAADISVSPSGASASVLVRSTAALSGKKVQLRIWACPTSSTCSPQLLPIPSNKSAATGYTKTVTMSVGKGGGQRFTLPLNLSPGSRKIVVQVVPLDVWERPGGPGLSQAGQLKNNQAVTTVTID